MEREIYELDVSEARGWLANFLNQFFLECDRLSDLDRQSGDGDFGSNLTPPFQAALVSLDETPTDTFSGLFGLIASPLWRTGGTSGPLLAVWFQAWGEVLGERDVVGTGDLSAALTKANASTVNIGGAQEGDKTMVDAMLPAARALVQASDTGMSLQEAFALAAEASRDGAAGTADLVARKGRSSYLGTRASGVLDPGAVLISMFFEAAPFVPPHTPLSNA